MQHRSIAFSKQNRTLQRAAANDVGFKNRAARGSVCNPMVQVIATADQAKLLAESNECVQIVNANGKRLGTLKRPSSDEDTKSSKIALKVTVKASRPMKLCRVSALRSDREVQGPIGKRTRHTKSTERWNQSQPVTVCRSMKKCST